MRGTCASAKQTHKIRWRGSVRVQVDEEDFFLLSNLLEVLDVDGLGRSSEW